MILVCPNRKSSYQLIIFEKTIHSVIGVLKRICSRNLLFFLWDSKSIEQGFQPVVYVTSLCYDGSYLLRKEKNHLKVDNHAQVLADKKPKPSSNTPLETSACQVACACFPDRLLGEGGMNPASLMTLFVDQVGFLFHASPLFRHRFSRDHCNEGRIPFLTSGPSKGRLAHLLSNPFFSGPLSLLQQSLLLQIFHQHHSYPCADWNSSFLEVSLKHIPISVIHTEVPKFEPLFVLYSWSHPLLLQKFFKSQVFVNIHIQCRSYITVSQIFGDSLYFSCLSEFSESQTSV